MGLGIGVWKGSSGLEGKEEGLGEIRVKEVENIRLENSGSRYILLSYFLGNPLLMIGNKALTNLLLIFSWGNIC